jgi:hypothetical protein
MLSPQAAGDRDGQSQLPPLSHGWSEQVDPIVLRFSAEDAGGDASRLKTL